MNRAKPTPAASRNMRFHSDQPLMGLVNVGEACASSPSSRAVWRARSEW